jgi:NADH-quinone oxidoreductase subunit E
MAFRSSAKPEFQPKTFAFTADTIAKANKILAKYPSSRKQSALLPLLDIVQRQADNWLPIPAMQAVADFLEIPYIRVYEVASFYTMFNLEPVGKNLVQICRTTPCWLRGSNGLKDMCETQLEIKLGETTRDKKFTLVEVECLGACVNAPMVQINDDYYEDLNPSIMKEILVDLSKGKKPKIGTYEKRLNSAPISGMME